MTRIQELSLSTAADLSDFVLVEHSEINYVVT